MTPPPAYFPQAGEQALTGIRVVFPAALGPVPFAAMLLADLGAEVIRIDRAGAAGVIDTAPADDPRTRGQRSIGIDLKHPEGCAIAARLAASADVLLEGMRPGAMERLRLGPADLHAVNPRLIYGRATGWGQDGPLAQTVGHDINYIARSGALHPIGDPDRPPAVPLNLVADFGGGGAYLALGVLAALMQRERTGRGQVIDCAMVDGAASLTTMIHAMLGSGAWRPERGANLLDGAAPFYRTYRTADGRYVAVGAIEPAFYRALLDGLGLEPAQWPQHDRSCWAGQRAALAEIFASRTRAEWVERFRGSDACVTAVSTPDEAVADPELAVRGVFVDWDGVPQPAPAPRLSASPAVARPRCGQAADTAELLAELGLGEDEVDALCAARAVFRAPARP
ncbi:CoA transferase [Streptosporangium sp. NBC_01755]|uniref:CaiB/BaiF CoA transferase family protein n=1 Tax=unclassified Streptosporangium TaxID=2632669 RepID=UPI002DDA4E0C|nr:MULTISPECIES: CaiB/BaiF CoA-transferase family protein [unclassified Streptosporangium]WSA26749.1 CoA transferase [Streptosporangium sp. NBC_01810]WSD01826.1 CoA transferase [Streptosporangium sp. NBC_01755]